MSSVQNLRALINERLTAAAEEIFTEFVETIVQYEEEINRQRRLLEITWKPQITLHRIDLPQQHVHEENVLREQNLCNQDRNSGLDQEDQEPPQINEEQEELCTGQEGDQLVLMQEADMLVRCNSKCEEIRVFEKEVDKNIIRFDGERRLLDTIWKPQIMLHRIGLPQQHVCKKEKGLTDQQLFNQKTNFSLDQEDPEPSQIKEEKEELCTSLDQEDAEPPQIKEEQEELCTRLDQNDPEPPQIKEEQEELCTRLDQKGPEPPQIKGEQWELGVSQQGEQFILKQATDIILLTSTDEDNDHSELEPKSEQLLSYNSLVAESPHQRISKHVDSGSSRNEELKPKKSPNKNSSHSNNVDNSSMSENHCDTDTDRQSVKCDVHEGVKSHACNACGKSFRFRCKLKVYMMMHKGEKRFACKTCGKRFSESSNRTVHMRTHTGEKPFSCTTCGRSFDHSSHLTDHMRTHTGEKPYSCKICGKSFTRNSTLTVHTRIHTGEKPYFCETCGKSYIQRWNLKVHMRTHTGEKL